MDYNNPNNHSVAVLESRIDHLETELSYLDNLLIQCGFPEGVATLKMTAEELIREKELEGHSASPE